MNIPQVVSYGGGTNSAAMIVGLHAHGECPAAIVFADTGGEKPHTYEHLWTMQIWCESVGFPSIQIIRADQPQQRKDGSLEAECLRLHAMPSRAFGFGQCSDNWKVRPFLKWCASHIGEHVRLIGFHAGESHRASSRIIGAIRYPLLEWGWDYERCEAEIIAAGLPLPGKSACFFCPSSRPRQILDLRTRYPDLLLRALTLEANWQAMDGGGSVKGLGRNWSWAQMLKEHDAQGELFLDAPEQCGEACFT